MVIDFHTHIVPERVKKDRTRYAQADPGFASIYSDPKARLATADDLIAAMDRDGVDVSVALNYGWRTQSLCIEINDGILEAAARFPKRIIGFCNVAPQSGDAGLKEIERCVRGGVRGVGEVRPDIAGSKQRPVEAIRPVAEFCARNDLMLLTHSSEPVGHGYQGKGSATPEVIFSLATAFPKLKLVCAHWGGGLPFYALMPEVKEALKNVWFDTAASPFLYAPAIYGQMVDIIGADRILFGSDYPLIPARRYLKEIHAADLSPDAEDAIRSGNALRLLGLAGEKGRG